MDFGMNRVIEPKGSLPVTAWKIDNSKETSSEELRIALEAIHLEWDSFQQLASYCNYNDERLKSKIIDLVDKRGKLHNPFTESGGLAMGTIDQIGKNYYLNNTALDNFCLGERVYCLYSLAGIPIHIDTIDKIDYNYGQIQCTGYAIIFQSCPLFKVEPQVSSLLLLASLDEGSDIYSIGNLISLKGTKNIAIIARTPLTALLYSAAVKKQLNDKISTTIIMDESAIGTVTRDQLLNLLSPFTNSFYCTNLSKPMDCYNEILKSSKNLSIDMCVITEDEKGAEALAVLLVKENGQLYFTSLKNNYSSAVLLTQTIHKKITAYCINPYHDSYYHFVMALITSTGKSFNALDEYYSSSKGNNTAYRNRFDEKIKNKTDGFIHSSPVTKDLIAQTLNIAAYDCNVIIQGETGVGKEKIMEIIYENSSRKNRPCVKINCAAIQENLAESEFFGYEAGAFTGAISSGKAGYFELADKGILFLDEIGQLSMNMQSKLLRVLQENQFYRVGGISPVNVNVRIICANNASLKSLSEKGEFRKDLYYRLNICTIEVPPLRKRSQDIESLTYAFLDKYSRLYGITKEISPQGLALLCDYSWPGNVRELENTVHRILINCPEALITEDYIEEFLYNDFRADDLHYEHGSNDSLDFEKHMEIQEKKLISYALKKMGSTTKAARFLNMSQPTFYRKKSKYGL